VEGLNELFVVGLVVAGFVWLLSRIRELGDEDEWSWPWRVAWVGSILLFLVLTVEYLLGRS
jgi:hypothetical protein